MKNALLLSLCLIVPGLFAHAQEFMGLTRSHISPELKNSTLLVIKYKAEDTNSVNFNNRMVDRKEQQAFHEKINDQIDKLNHHLEQTFKHYHYNVILIDEEDLDKYDPETYRFVYDRYMVRMSLKKKPKKGYFTYSHYFKDRSTGRTFRDIELYSPNKAEADRVIVKELNAFLLDPITHEEELEETPTQETEENTEESNPRYIREDDHPHQD